MSAQDRLQGDLVLEQAKGIVAQRGDLDMDPAFSVLRRYARDHNRRLADVARAVVSRELSAQRLLSHGASRGANSPPPAGG